jgi:hypothetical protein
MSLTNEEQQQQQDSLAKVKLAVDTVFSAHVAFLLYLADHITYKNLNHQIYLGKLLQREKTQKKIYNTPLNIFF